MSQTKTALLAGTLDLIVLRTLRRGPMHGYGVAQRIQQVSDDVLQVNQGSLYPALQRLERDGLIAASWGRSENNRRARFYELTDAGRRRLRSDQREWRAVSGAIERILAAT